MALRLISLSAAFTGVAAEVFVKERCDDGIDGWAASSWKTNDKNADGTAKDGMGVFAHTPGKWFVDADEQKGLATTEDMKFHAVSKPFDKPFSNKGKDLVVQFQVKHEGYSYGHCAGGYIKLLPKKGDPATFGGDTEYNIMFGPDMCSYDVSRIHLIFNKGGENLLKKDEIKLDYDDKNEFTHLYTLHLKPDNSAEVFLDQKSKWSGKLSDGWDFPGETIRDPEDPKQVPDPSASKPADWNDEDDGDWEPTMIENPAPKMIPNPEYGGDVYAYEFEALGFDLWTVNNGTIFDNVLVCDDIKYAEAFAASTWGKFKDTEKEAKEKFDKPSEPPSPPPADDDKDL